MIPRDIFFTTKSLPTIKAINENQEDNQVRRVTQYPPSPPTSSHSPQKSYLTQKTKMKPKPKTYFLGQGLPKRPHGFFSKVGWKYLAFCMILGISNIQSFSQTGVYIEVRNKDAIGVVGNTPFICSNLPMESITLSHIPACESDPNNPKELLIRAIEREMWEQIPASLNGDTARIEFSAIVLPATPPFITISRFQGLKPDLKEVCEIIESTVSEIWPPKECKDTFSSYSFAFLMLPIKAEKKILIFNLDSSKLQQTN